MKVVHAVLLFGALTGSAICLFTRKYIFVASAKNWNNARTTCRNHYLDLATINSPDDLEAVRENLMYGLSWIGLRRIPPETNFTTWSDGSKVEFTRWNSGEPKMSNNYLCVYLNAVSFVAGNCAEPMAFTCYEWTPTIIVVKQMMNWEDALNYCRTNYTDLVSLSNDGDLCAVKKMTPTNQSLSLWTGLRFMNGLWFWVNKEPLGTLTSMSSCPTRPFHCGALTTGGYILESRNCSEEMNFICY